MNRMILVAAVLMVASCDSAADPLAAAVQDETAAQQEAAALEAYRVDVAPPAAPIADEAGDVLEDTVTAWRELERTLAAAVDERRHIVVDLGGQTIEQGDFGRASIKGDDLTLRNGTIDGQIELNQNAERIVIENVTFILGDNEDAIRAVARNGERPRDVLLRDVTVQGTNASHGLDCSRGIERLRVERLTVSGVRYGAYFDGDSHDIEFIEPTITDIRSEHGLRMQNTKRMNVIGGVIEAGPKTAITIRRGCSDIAILGVTAKGQISVGPDKRDFGHPVNSERITIAGCTIDTSAGRDRPIIFWPPVVDSRVIGNTCTSREGSTFGYLLLAQQQFSREPQPVIVRGNTYNGVPREGARGVDGPSRLVRDQ